jgi:hypothetical protein
MNSILPNPFELFKKKENFKNNSKSTKSDTKPKNEKETKPKNEKENKPKSDVSKIDNTKPQFFVLLFTIAFSVLFLLSSFIYYLTNSFLYKHISRDRYTSKRSENGERNDFWSLFRAKVIESKFWTFVLLWGFVVFINIIIMTEVFKIKEPLNIFTITSIYFACIVGTTFLFIGNIPSLIEVFENTFGYSIINTFFGLKNKMSVFKSKYFDNSVEGEKSLFEMPFDVLITPFDVPNFNDIFDELPKEPNPNTDFYLLTRSNEELEETRKDILKLVFIKNTVGHFSWTFLASVLTIMATINTML